MTILAFLAITLQEDYASIRKAAEAYGKAKSVSGVLECEIFGNKEVWTFSKMANGEIVLRTPVQWRQSSAGLYTNYLPVDNSVYRERLPANTRMSIDELWPFTHIGMGVGAPPQYLRSQGQPRKAMFAGKAAWVTSGFPLPERTKGEAFLDVATGELLGWHESWGGSGWNKRFKVKSLSWNEDAKSVSFTVPKKARQLKGDELALLPPGQGVADFALIDETGGKISLAKLLTGRRGSVLSIGSVGCGPCEAAKKFAHRNAKAFKSGGIAFVALESWGCTQEQLQQIAKANPVLEHIYRPEVDDLRYRLKLGGAPTIYLLDAQRRVIHSQQGFEAKEFSQVLAKEFGGFSQLK